MQSLSEILNINAKKIHLTVNVMTYNSLKSPTPTRWMNQNKPEHLSNLKANKENIELKMNETFTPLNKMNDFYQI